MESFHYIEEQKLVRKVFEIHDKIFAKPAKRYIFYLKLVDVAGGTIYPGYMYVENNVNKQIIYTDKLPALEFGDRIIVVTLEKKMNCENDIILTKNIFKNLPPHEAIVITCNFLYFRQMIQLFRESLMNYKPGVKKDVKITQLVSIKNILKDFV